MKKENATTTIAMPGINLFFDSSVLFTGVASATGAARALLILAETGHITITISEQVVTETERALARKAPRALKDFRRAILASQAQIVHDPSRELVKANLDLVTHSSDIPILLAAMQSNADFFVTLNRKHFIDDPQVAVRSGLKIGSPADALTWVRGQISSGIT